MVISFDAAKLQQLFDIRKYFCNYFYFYGDFSHNNSLQVQPAGYDFRRREMRAQKAKGKRHHLSKNSTNSSKLR